MSTSIWHIINWYTKPWFSICKGRSFRTRLVNLGGGNPLWVLEQISSKHWKTMLMVGMRLGYVIIFPMTPHYLPHQVWKKLEEFWINWIHITRVVRRWIWVHCERIEELDILIKFPKGGHYIFLQYLLLINNVLLQHVIFLTFMSKNNKIIMKVFSSRINSLIQGYYTRIQQNIKNSIVKHSVGLFLKLHGWKGFSICVSL